MSDRIVPAGANGVDPIQSLILRAAGDPSFDVQKFEVLVRLQMESADRAAHRDFNRAMARAQTKMQAVPRDASNDYLQARYAKLDGMLSVVLPNASEEGLHIRFGSQPAETPGWKCVTLTVSHDNGHTETTALEGPVVSSGSSGGRTQMTPIQAVGSTVTYLKRYLLGMVFALVLSDEQDDDGEASRPVRRPSGPTPPSHPPYQPGPAMQPGKGDGQTPPPPAQEGRTRANGSGGTDTAGQWRSSLQIALDACRSHAAIDAMVAGASFVAWRAKASMEQDLEIGRMIGLRRSRLTAEAAQPPAPPAEGLGDLPTDDTPTPEERALIAEIMAMDIDTLDSAPTTPAFNMRLLALPTPMAQDRISAALKVRAEQLQEAKA